MRQLAISESEQEQTYKVLPDTSLVIGIQYSGKLAQVEDKVKNALSTAGITGLLNSYRVFSNTPGTGSVLIYFNEQGASAFFRQPMHELFGESVALDNFLPPSVLETLREQLAEARTDEKRIRIAEHFLISQLRFPETDPLVNAAIQYIRQSNGVIRIAELCSALYISQAALEKRFRKVVGTSPKKYAAIIRFNSVIRSFSGSRNLTDLALNSGYYDQAHFIHDFRKFSGQSPQDFFSS